MNNDSSFKKVGKRKAIDPEKMNAFLETCAGTARENIRDSSQEEGGVKNMLVLISSGTEDNSRNVFAMHGSFNLQDFISIYSAMHFQFASAIAKHIGDGTVTTDDIKQAHSFLMMVLLDKFDPQKSAPNHVEHVHHAGATDEEELDPFKQTIGVVCKGNDTTN